MTEFLPGTPLEKDRVVPGVPMTADSSGDEVSLWDFRQRAALALCFLHDRCESCAGYARKLAKVSGELREFDAIALAVVGESAALDLPVLVDTGTRARQRFLGPAAEMPLVLIVDRYGTAWRSFRSRGHAFPPPEEVVDTLRHPALQCPECGAPAW
jgi:hypothetical protein